MKKLITAILSVLLLAAFIPARCGVLSQVHPDTTWKPLGVLLKNEYGQQTFKWVKGYYNPLVSDTVATGKIMRINFTNVAQNVSGWDDYIFGSWKRYSASDSITDGTTGWKIIRIPGSAWTSSTYGANASGITTPDGGGWAFNKNIDSIQWYNFKGILDSTLKYSNPLQPNFYITGLDTSKYYKLQILSSFDGTSSADSANYSYFLISNQTSVHNQGTSNVTNPVIYSQKFYNNTSKLITTLYIKPSANYLNGIYVLFGGYGADEADQYGVINAMTITEYNVQTN